MEPGALVTEISGATYAGSGATQTPLEALYHAHRLPLVRLAVLLVGDLGSAEEIVQDAFLSFQRHRRRIADPDSELAYLRTTVANGCRSNLRRRVIRRRYVAPHAPPAASAETEALLHEEHREVLLALHRLPDRQRTVLVLRYWTDLSVREIADTLTITEGTVKSTTARALAALEKILGDP